MSLSANAARKDILTMPVTDNKRHYSRLPFIGQAKLLTHDGEHRTMVEDISLKGAMVRFSALNPLRVGDPCQLHLSLSAEESLVMRSQEEFRPHHLERTVARDRDTHKPPAW